MVFASISVAKRSASCRRGYESSVAISLCFSSHSRDGSAVEGNWMTGGSVGPQASPDHLAWICAPPHSRSFSISTNGSRESGKIVDIRRNAPNVKVPIRGGRISGVLSPYVNNRQKRCPKSSATSIGLRTHTLATIDERISYSHPAFTVAGATRIQHHLWNLWRS